MFNDLSAILQRREAQFFNFLHSAWAEVGESQCPEGKGFEDAEFESSMTQMVPPIPGR
jgi:hypothetical protein